MSTKWVQEIQEHCPGVKVVLCALKCDLREEQEKDDEDDQPLPPQRMIPYNEGLEVARKIGALRYLGMWSILSLRSVLTIARMFRYAKPGSKRGIHRSRQSRPPGQACEVERRQQVHHHVRHVPEVNRSASSPRQDTLISAILINDLHPRCPQFSSAMYIRCDAFSVPCGTHPSLCPCFSERVGFLHSCRAIW